MVCVYGMYVCMISGFDSNTYYDIDIICIVFLRSKYRIIAEGSQSRLSAENTFS